MPVVQLVITDPALREAVAEQLSSWRLATVAEKGDLAAALTDGNVAAIILDDGDADKKNLRVLRESSGKRKPVLLLGALKDSADGELIAETFAKPLRLGHLLARLRFYLQNAPRLFGAAVTFGPYRFEPANRQIVTAPGGAVIRLTEKETALLDYIARSEKPVSREELLAAIWGYDAEIDTHTLETHIYQLRRKLDPQGTGAAWLLNEQGAYRLNDGKPAS